MTSFMKGPKIETESSQRKFMLSLNKYKIRSLLAWAVGKFVNAFPFSVALWHHGRPPSGGLGIDPVTSATTSEAVAACINGTQSTHSKAWKIYQFVILSLYCKNTEPLCHSFMYSLVSLLSGIYQLPAMHSLLVTLLVPSH